MVGANTALISTTNHAQFTVTSALQLLMKSNNQSTLPAPHRLSCETSTFSPIFSNDSNAWKTAVFVVKPILCHDLPSLAFFLFNTNINRVDDPLVCLRLTDVATLLSGKLQESESEISVLHFRIDPAPHDTGTNVLEAPHYVSGQGHVIEFCFLVFMYFCLQVNARFRVLKISAL